MKYLRLALAAIVVSAVPSMVSAAECPLTEPTEPTPGSNPAKDACPSLYLRGENALDPANPATVTTASLKAIEPCKEESCLSVLKNGSAPDCTVNGVNMKAYQEVTIKLCEAFNAGSVTVEAATALFEPVFKNAVDPTSGSNANANATSPAPTTNAVDATTPTVPAPTTTPKSGAVGATVTGVVVFVTATAVHWLV